jgi:N-methylhydantoinase A/oxoprolinase/acetone carboxylase beta subunit
MAYLLGIDTGGTYTDAVILQDEARVIAASKSLTTRHDLAEGIGKAAQAVLQDSGISADQISMASLSTTLATNALVEGQGGKVALVFVGFRDGDLEKHGLSDALAGDPVLTLAGGHNHAGGEVAPLDMDALTAWVTGLDGVSAFAVAAQFATRNPSHELKITEALRRLTGKPVSASHQLSAKLNGPKRALTAVLNARLIGMIDRLIQRAAEGLADLGVNAPLMVVRGDGALISADQAREKPIETILSGPAASIVGARWLTQAQNALVSDIGGTTTDVAVLRDGQPAIDPNGAQVGKYRTMVEAVAMRTTGLGGDSEVHFISQGLRGGVTLGPRRVLPISLAAKDAPQVVHDALDNQLRSVLPSDFDGRFIRRMTIFGGGGLPARDQAVFDRITPDLQPLSAVVKTRIDTQAIVRMVARGMVQIAALTPTDASHALGRVDVWDKEAAEKALLLFGRRRTGAGEMLSTDPKHMAQMIIDRLTHQTGLALLETAFAEENDDFDDQANDVLARHVLTQRGLRQHRGLMKIDIGVNVPVIGLGASAPTYYPAVGELLGCDMILPEHAGVANAIGAVVGRVTFRASATITCPNEGQFRVHHGTSPVDFRTEDEAIAYLTERLSDQAMGDAKAAGAEDIQVSVHQDLRKSTIEGREVFVEGTITAEAAGRPRIAV